MVSGAAGSLVTVLSVELSGESSARYANSQKSGNYIMFDKHLKPHAGHRKCKCMVIWLFMTHHTCRLESVIVMVNKAAVV